MSCSFVVAVVGDDPTDGLDYAELRIRELEERWSRFIDGSEITGLNRAGGAPRRCSSDTVRLVEESVRAWHATEGAFDPTLIGTLVELGYASSRADVTRRTSLTPDIGGRGRPDQIRVDPGTGVVRFPHATALDPGGLGKGLAADLIVGELLSGGVDGAMVEIGGDVRVAGRSPHGDHWSIRVAPTPSDPPVRVELSDGAVATSSSRIRTWQSGGEQHHHHLIDPVSLRPTDRDVVSTTVVAGTAAWAEAFTKVGFVAGADEAMDHYSGRGLAARITLDDGTCRHTPAWEEFAR